MRRMVVPGDGRGNHREEKRFRREDADVDDDPALGHHRDLQHQHQRRHQSDDPVAELHIVKRTHKPQKRNVETRASDPRVKATANNSGTRKSRILAFTVSSRTIAQLKKSSFASSQPIPCNAPKPNHVGWRPIGQKQLINSVIKTSCLMETAHSMRARYGPEYSRIMASWIMVSSRWVSGLSTGIRPVSAISTSASAANANICAGARKRQFCPMAAPAISVRPVEPAPMATVKMASIIAGSARAEMVISRLLPRPPKELPPSNPLSASTQRPSPSR